MQEIQETGAKNLDHDNRVSSQSFGALLALARGSLTNGELHASLGMNPSEFGQLLDGLRRKRLVSVASEHEWRSDKQTLRLTDKGERVLLHEMEQMCELPER